MLKIKENLSNTPKRRSLFKANPREDIDHCGLRLYMKAGSRWIEIEGVRELTGPNITIPYCFDGSVVTIKLEPSDIVGKLRAALKTQIAIAFRFDVGVTAYHFTGTVYQFTQYFYDSPGFEFVIRLSEVLEERVALKESFDRLVRSGVKGARALKALAKEITEDLNNSLGDQENERSPIKNRRNGRKPALKLRGKARKGSGASTGKRKSGKRAKRAALRG